MVEERRKFLPFFFMDKFSNFTLGKNKINLEL